METFRRFSSYSQLAKASQEVRFIRIFLDYDDVPLRVRFEIHDLDSAPRYHALSYTWGDPGILSPISVNGILVHVRENAGAFLKSMRLIYGEILVWMDCLCINQDDHKERSHQVELMGDIYRKAAFVHAWLGPATCASRLVFDKALELRFAKPHDKLYHLYGDGTNESIYWKRLARCKIRPAIRAILLRPFWTRVWVLQEMLLAKDIIFTCGSDIMFLKDLTRLCDVCAMCQPYTGDVAYSKGWSTLDKVAVYRSQDSLHWDSTFSFFSHLECTDPRDQVYGFRQFFADPGSLSVDYSKSALDVYMDLLRTGLLCEPYGINSALHVLKSMQESFHSLTQSALLIPMDFAPIPILRSFYVTFHTDVSPLTAMFDLQVSFTDLDLPPLRCSMRRGMPATSIVSGDIIGCFGKGSGMQEVGTVLILRKRSPSKFTYVAGFNQLLSYSQSRDRPFPRCYCSVMTGSSNNTVIEIDRQALSSVLSKQTGAESFHLIHPNSNN